MPGETISPSMGLILPGVGVTPGPQYATDQNASLTIIDTHDHSSGKGVQITPAGLNINADLSMGMNNLIQARSVRLSAQGSPIALPTDLTAIYASGVDLYYNDGLGNQIRITQSGAVAGTPGSISNLVSPASASYVSGSSTFVFQSDANTAANIDVGSVVLRNLVASSPGLTLSPPTLSSNYTITLPTLPVASAFLTIDSSGNVSASPALAGGITTSMIAPLNVTTGTIADGAVTPAKLSGSLTFTSTTFTASGSFVVPASVTSIMVEGIGGGGGGAGGGTGAPNQGGAGGTSGYFLSNAVLATTPGETLTIVIGAGGGGTAVGNAGQAGQATTITGLSGTLRMYGGQGGLAASAQTATVPAQKAGLTAAGGGVGGAAGSAGSAGGDSLRTTGSAGMGAGSLSGGGGGGAGYAAAPTPPPGNIGGIAPANSGGGGGGGSDQNSGGDGGSGRLTISYPNFV